MPIPQRSPRCGASVGLAHDPNQLTNLPRQRLAPERINDAVLKSALFGAARTCDDDETLLACTTEPIAANVAGEGLCPTTRPWCVGFPGF